MGIGIGARTVVVALGVSLLIAGASFAISLDASTTGSYSNPSGFAVGTYSILNDNPNSEFQWGDATASNRSSLTFAGQSISEEIAAGGTTFALGDLTFVNRANAADDPPHGSTGSAELDILMTITNPTGSGSPYTFNFGLSIRDIHAPGQPDTVTVSLLNPLTTFSFVSGDKKYYLEATGFSSGAETLVLTADEPRHGTPTVADSISGRIWYESIELPAPPTNASAPEPATLSLLGIGIAVAGLRARKRLAA